MMDLQQNFTTENWKNLLFVSIVNFYLTKFFRLKSFLSMTKNGKVKLVSKEKKN